VGLEGPAALEEIFDQVDKPPTALTMAHCESVDSGLLDPTIESSARSSPRGTKEKMAASSGSPAMRVWAICLMAQAKASSIGITSERCQPGPTDTGRMVDDLKAHIIAATPLGRLGAPQDCAILVAFFRSPARAGGWINRQLLHRDGGI
jgi:3-oxoacyl-[acyl-carrier protein] reductase